MWLHRYLNPGNLEYETKIVPNLFDVTWLSKTPQITVSWFFLAFQTLRECQLILKFFLEPRDWKVTSPGTHFFGKDKMSPQKRQDWVKKDKMGQNRQKTVNFGLFHQLIFTFLIKKRYFRKRKKTRLRKQRTSCHVKRQDLVRKDKQWQR